MASKDAPPSARVMSFSAAAGENVYLWGGSGDSEPDIVFVYQRDTEAWSRRLTKGPHPPQGLCGGGCAISGKRLYIYGGYEGKSFYGELRELNMNSWWWINVCEGGKGGPGKKRGCRMISYQDILLVVGGSYKETPASKQPGATYSNGWTNEVHCYNLITGLWSSPSMKGSRPLPCSSFSFTLFDDDQAVMLGGFPHSHTSYQFLHLATMTWSMHKISNKWLRSSHIAACLDYGGQHKTLLISGGLNNTTKYDDMWLLDLESGRMEKLKILEKYKKLFQKHGHIADTVIINSDCNEVVLFGGFNNECSLTPETVVVRFELQKMSPRGGKWSLTDIADHTQLGSPDRLATKRRMIQSSSSQNTTDDAMRRLERQLQGSQIREEHLQMRAEELQRQAEEAGEYLSETRRSLRQYEEDLQHLSTHWVIRREEIELTGPELGVGGWATVTVAKFRGTEVAVKRIHRQIISQHNLQLFQREMNMASRLRHPNLIQFIGATVEGESMIIMELMSTSLRSQLEKEVIFEPNLVKAISLDVARGLNYLHLFQPDPIIHRDISSANVLLEELPHENWRAKITDYGSVNLVRQLSTQNPGSPVYSAPESANSHLQSPKMDIYSFGALILEMLSGRLPAPEQRPGLLCQVHHDQFLRLIRRCLKEKREDRPSASDIISELSS